MSGVGGIISVQAVDVVAILHNYGLHYLLGNSWGKNDVILLLHVLVVLVGENPRGRTA